MDTKKSVEALQFFTTGLTRGAFVHKLQGQIFKSQGFTKLGQKYIDHFTEEMGWVEQFVNRILDLGCEVKAEEMKGEQLISNPVDYIKADLAIQVAGVDLLYKCMETLREDPTTYDIMKGYLKDEEEDLYWSQEQLELIEKIGEQNWLIQQL
ncbi:MAG: bacterioferritin (cytochrome b1) [bacterium P3]|nr:MAG: bacterioferritin (cytochrome b1) [bacterium P3]KWW40143.1 MAG: bacterioferritin (cytochrome b1) [bacterium F083]